MPAETFAVKMIIALNVMTQTLLTFSDSKATAESQNS